MQYLTGHGSLEVDFADAVGQIHNYNLTISHVYSLMLSDPVAHTGIDDGQVVIFFNLEYNRVVDDRTLVGQKGPVNTSAGRQGLFL